MDKAMKTMAELAAEMADDDKDFMESLDALANEKEEKERLKQLHDEIAAIYQAGQRTSLRDGLHVSDVIGRSHCPRKMVLLHCYQQNEIIHGQRLAAIYENGKDIHTRWQQKFENAGVALYIEMPHIEDFWKMLFTPDIIAMFRGRPTIFELKGYNTWDFKRMAGKRKLPKDAILQCNVYMWFTGIHYGVIIIEDKNTQEFLALDVEYDPALVAPYEKEFNLIAKAIEGHIADPTRLPARLAVCDSPTADVPAGCGACMSCFSTIEQRENLRRPVAWGVEYAYLSSSSV